MGSIFYRYALLFLGQVLATATVLVQQHADKATAQTGTADQISTFLALAASWVVTTLGGRLLHKAPPPPELVPTPIAEPDANQELAKAAGEAFEAASKATSAAAAAKKP